MGSFLSALQELNTPVSNATKTMDIAIKSLFFIFYQLCLQRYWFSLSHTKLRFRLSNLSNFIFFHTQKTWTFDLYWSVRVSTPFYVQYMQKPTQQRERFALFRKHRNSNCREMNGFQNKANAYLLM